MISSETVSQGWHKDLTCSSCEAHLKSNFCISDKKVNSFDEKNPAIVLCENCGAIQIYEKGSLRKINPQEMMDFIEQDTIGAHSIN